MNSIETMSRTQDLLDRRKAIVPQGVSVFVESSIESGHGAVITDTDGKELLDFGGGIGVLNAGHAPEPVVRAIQDQAEKFIHTCFHVTTYEVYLEVCEKLAELFPHGPKTKVMLTNTGAESVENAIKIARQSTGRAGVICFTDAFHGRSMMAMSLTSKTDYKLGCGPFAPEVYRLQFPNIYRYGTDMTEDQFVARELKRLWESARNLVDPKNVAAVIIELVQGEGGFNIAPKGYIKGLRQFCDEHGIVLIFDEVQTGFCRTGEWGAQHHYDVIPDITLLAKSIAAGMPLGAVVGKAHIMDAAKPGTIGGTYLGNPVSCAAALATIRFMEDNELNARAMEIGSLVHNRLRAMQRKYGMIGDVRALGAMQAMEFVKNGDPLQPDSERCAALAKACLERGLLLVHAGTHKNVIRFLPPLVISDEQLGWGLNVIEEECENLKT
jgi:4-aminobutyrate aminotransferase/(S)-3-amino-2-methylpropionate transaminase